MHPTLIPALAVLAVFSTACRSPVQDRYWTIPEGREEAFAADKEECQRESVAALDEANPPIDEMAYIRCMQLRGWRHR